MYFPKYKLAKQVDEKGHNDRDERKENDREEKIKTEPECKFVIINPNAEGFDIFLEISKIQHYIDQSNKKNKRTRRQNKRTRRRNKKTKKQVCKRIIELHVQYF